MIRPSWPVSIAVWDIAPPIVRRIATVKDPDLIRAIQKAYAAENVCIAEVGAWKNMLDPDAEKRRQNLEYVVDRCALAEAVGARCCVDIAGSYNPDSWYGPNPKNLSKEFFDATVANCRHVIDSVKPTRTRFTIEMMGWSIPDGPDSYLELIRAVDRKAFGVHLDVCNGINSPRRFYENTAYINECFSQARPVDRLMPRQRSEMGRRAERAFPRSDSGPGPDRLQDLSARPLKTQACDSAHAGASGNGRGI